MLSVGWLVSFLIFLGVELAFGCLLWQGCPWRRSWQCSWPYHSSRLFLFVLWHLFWADGKGQVDIIKLQLDLSKEYGIVLEGGGAKGAYQIGAWRALREAGIRIKGAAGTSVGALNGALICMDDFEKAERIWENISYSRVMDVDDELMERLTKFSLKNISSLAPLNVGELIAGAIRVLRDGGFDIAPLRALIEDVVDEEKIRNSDRELYVVTYSISDRHPLIADVKEAPEGGIADLLMASAYLLGFRQERLGGK